MREKRRDEREEEGWKEDEREEEGWKGDEREEGGCKVPVYKITANIQLSRNKSVH